MQAKDSLRRIAAILTQSDLTQKSARTWNTLFPAVIHLSLLSLVGFVLWWSWPAADPIFPASAALEQAVGTDARAVLTSLQASKPGQGVERPLPTGNQPPTVRLPTQNLPRVMVVSARPITAPVEPAQADNLTALTTATTADSANPQNESSGISILVATATSFVASSVEPVSVVVPQVRVIPAVGLELPPTPEPPTPTPLPTPTPAPLLLDVNPGRLWSTFTPKAAPDNDHFWVGRPFAANVNNQLASPNYQFGSTAGDRYRPHHGMDMENPSGTPVLAAVDGEVVHAGPDNPELLGPYNNFYGNTVVIRLDRQMTVAGGQLDVFLLYGHLSQVTVAVEQRVKPEDVVGLVGMTGIAIGPHLHVEIRLGANTYYNNVNPYLWMQPLPGQGAVAVRLLTAKGRTWSGARLSLVRFENNVAVWGRQIVTYMDTENIGPDPAWGENGAMDGAAAGAYYLVGVVNSEQVKAQLTVRAGETTFVELRTKQ